MRNAIPLTRNICNFTPSEMYQISVFPRAIDTVPSQKRI